MGLKVIILVVVLVTVYAQVPDPEPCPDLPVVQDFQLEKYLGKWYEIEKEFAFYELGGKCITAQYTLNDNGTVEVLNKQLNEVSDEETSIQGTVHFAGDSSEAKLIVNFPSIPIQIDAPYWVLATDYDNYSVVWSCYQIGEIISTRNAWLLARDNKPSEEIMNTVYEELDRFNISRELFLTTDQTNCPDSY